MQGVAPVKVKITRAIPRARSKVSPAVKAKGAAAEAPSRKRTVVGRRPQVSMSRPATKKPLSPASQRSMYCGRRSDSPQPHSSRTRSEAKAVTPVASIEASRIRAEEPARCRRGTVRRETRGRRSPTAGRVSGRARRARATSKSGTAPAK